VDADERDVVLLEQVDQLGEVAERAAEAVDLVDRDDVDVPPSMSRSRPGTPRSFGRAPEKPPSSTSWRLLSSPARLALDVGFDGLPLRVEAVERLVETVVTLLRVVDRDSDRAWWRVGSLGSPPLGEPEDSFPFQFAPVIAWRTADSERKSVLFHS